MVYLFVGTDPYQKTSGAKAVVDKLVAPENRDFGLEVIDASCDTADAAVAALDRAREALYTESFFGDGKVVWLKEANFLPGARNRVTEAQATKEAVEAFAALLAATPLPEAHTLLITAPTCSGASAFGKWIAKVGKVVPCGESVAPGKSAAVAAERLAALLPKSELKMSSTVQQAFAQRVGADSWTILSELEKLRTYLGKAGAEVTLADLEVITCTAASAEPFEISNAICARSPGRVAKAVAQLSNDKNAAFPAAAMVLNLLNELVALRDALDRGFLSGGRWTLPPEQVPARLRTMSGWMLPKRVEAARRYTLNELRAARHYAIEMRFKLVDSTAQDPWTIVEPVLLRIVARRPTR